MAPTARSRLTSVATAAATVAGLVLAAPAAPAGAEAAAVQSPFHSITTYQKADFTGAPHTTVYSCGTLPTVIPTNGFASYRNLPPLNCRLVLVTPAGQKHPLCAGRAVVPEPFRQATALMTQPGTGSKPCPPGWPVT